MPQLDYITNVSFILTIVLIYSTAILVLSIIGGELLHFFTESLFSVSFNSPAFLAVLTKQTLAFAWASIQTLKVLKFKKILTLKF